MRGEVVDVDDDQRQRAVVARGAGDLDGQPLVVGAAVAEAREGILAARAAALLAGGRVRHLRGNHARQQRDEVALVAAERAGLGAVHGQDTLDRALVDDRGTDDGDGAETAARLDVDAGVVTRVVGVDDGLLADARADEAVGGAGATADLRCRGAARGAVDDLIALHHLHEASVGAGHLHRQLGDEVDDVLEIQPLGGDLVLRVDDVPQDDGVVDGGHDPLIVHSRG